MYDAIVMPRLGWSRRIGRQEI